MESNAAIVVADNDPTPQSGPVPLFPIPIGVLVVVTQYLTLRQAREELEAQEKAAEVKVLERMTDADLKMLEHPLGMVLRVDAHERGQQLDVKAAREALAAAQLPIPTRPVMVRAHIKVLDQERSAEYAGTRA